MTGKLSLIRTINMAEPLPLFFMPVHIDYLEPDRIVVAIWPLSWAVRKWHEAVMKWKPFDYEKAWMEKHKKLDAEWRALVDQANARAFRKIVEDQLPELVKEQILLSTKEIIKSMKLL